jgi:hypothetical protein
MKKCNVNLIRLSLVLVLTGVLAFFTSCEKDDDLKDKEKLNEWTIIGYFDGNNNLDNGQLGTSYIIEDLQEMEIAGSSDDVQSIVMLASQKFGGKAKYYEIEKHSNQMPDEIKSPVLEDMGTKDMSDPETLRNFIKYAVENYPAKRYALIVNSHGAAWKGICPDEVNGAGDLMSVSSLKNALAESPVFDVLVFHSCLMSSVEVAYELRNKAKYMVASELNMPVLSILGADQWLSTLISDPEMESYDFAREIAQVVYDRGAESQRETHMAVVDMSKLDALASKISDLGNRLVSESGDNWGEVRDAWKMTHYISNDFPSLTDIREFSKQLIKQPNISKINLISSATTNLISAINEAVPFTNTNQTTKPCGGLSIHFPGFSSELDLQDYNKLEFQKTNWSAFLEQFSTKGNASISGKITWTGHSLSSNCKIIVCYQLNNELEVLGRVDVPTNGIYNFSITNMTDPKNYMFYVHDDINSNGEIDSGDGSGFWDKDADNIWTFDDVLTVEPGKTYSNINIKLSLEKSAQINTNNLLNSLNMNNIKDIPILK